MTPTSATESTSVIFAEAPDEVKPVLVKIKTEQGKDANMKRCSWCQKDSARILKVS